MALCQLGNKSCILVPIHYTQTAFGFVLFIPGKMGQCMRFHASRPSPKPKKIHLHATHTHTQQRPEGEKSGRVTCVLEQAANKTTPNLMESCSLPVTSAADSLTQLVHKKKPKSHWVKSNKHSDMNESAFHRPKNRKADQYCARSATNPRGPGCWSGFNTLRKVSQVCAFVCVEQCESSHCGINCQLDEY